MTSSLISSVSSLSVDALLPYTGVTVTNCSVSSSSVCIGDAGALDEPGDFTGELCCSCVLTCWANSIILFAVNEQWKQLKCNEFILTGFAGSVSPGDDASCSSASASSSSSHSPSTSSTSSSSSRTSVLGLKSGPSGPSP